MLRLLVYGQTMSLRPLNISFCSDQAAVPKFYGCSLTTHTLTGLVVILLSPVGFYWENMIARHCYFCVDPFHRDRILNIYNHCFNRLVNRSDVTYSASVAGAPSVLCVSDYWFDKRELTAPILVLIVSLVASLSSLWGITLDIVVSFIETAVRSLSHFSEGRYRQFGYIIVFSIFFIV